MRQAAAAADAASANEMAATGPSRPITDGVRGLGDASADETAATGQSRPITDGGPELGKAVVRPDVVSYSAAITACANAGQRRRALTLLRDMRAEGVFPNVSRRQSVTKFAENGLSWLTISGRLVVTVVDYQVPGTR